MYTLARILLILTIVACCYCMALIAMAGGGGLVYLAIPIVFIAVRMRRRSERFTAHGTARWATLGRFAVRRNGGCKAWADHREGLEQFQDSAEEGSG